MYVNYASPMDGVGRVPGTETMIFCWGPVLSLDSEFSEIARLETGWQQVSRTQDWYRGLVWWDDFF